MDKKYTERISKSESVGSFDGTVWKVNSTLTERRKEKDGEWETTGMSITVFDTTFENAQKLAVGFLYDVIMEAVTKSEIESPSLFDLEIPKETSLESKGES